MMKKENMTDKQLRLNNMELQISVLKGYINHYLDNLCYPISELYKDWYGHGWEEKFHNHTLTPLIEQQKKERMLAFTS